MDTAATNTLDAVNRLSDNLARMTFVHGWAVIVGAVALGLVLGWKLWKG